jgi:transcriptional regulator GlxA family with amidase domain
MSLSQLRRVFHAAWGMTMTEYHTACRVTEMQRLLAGSDLPVGQIARRVGWTSRAWAVTQFTKTTGETPAVYRARAHALRSPAHPG